MALPLPRLRTARHDVAAETWGAVMTDRHQRENGDNRGENADGPRPDGEFIDGPHGTHGGGLESEGRPQEKQPESTGPSKRRDRQQGVPGTQNEPPRGR
jgi:hypothetical protein